MKVCILSNDDPAAFQSSINAFIADKKVIDIKYQSMNLTLKFTNGVPSESIQKWNAKMKGESHE